MPQQPLLVHLVSHPASSEGRDLACQIHRQLNAEAVVPSLHIPTIFSAVSGENRPPERPPFGLARKNFVVVLADDHMVPDDDWCRYVADVWEGCVGSDLRCVPFQLSKNAWPLDERLRAVSFSRAYSLPSAAHRLAFVTRRIVVELCRFLRNLSSKNDATKAPVRLFLSHTKLDIDTEPKVTRELIRTLTEDQPVEAWVDSGKIPGGSEFAKEIASGVQETSLLVVLTDNYATREWCREEVLLAKEHQRPIAVIDALSKYEVRSFPYIGNVPRVRWDGNPQKGIDLLLKETLRNLHSLQTLERFQQPGDQVFAYPPEFATLAGMTPGSSVLYPDPPLGNGEMSRLSKTRVNIATPLQRLALDRPLRGKRIAISMSESTDIVRFGLDQLHLDAAITELSRYLLIKGATLAYGGHLGAEGYTQKLYELVQAHNNSDGGGAPVERIVNFRGWPLPRLSVKQLAETHALARTQELPRPADIDETLHKDFKEAPAFFSATASAAHRFAWARGMTEMRVFQAETGRSGVVARIVLGGTFGPTMKVIEDGTREERWYGGRVPGVLEEVVLSAQADQPVFLLGAFGGAARLVIDLLHGVDRQEATWDYQKRAPFAAEMKDMYLQRRLPWLDYPEMISLLRTKEIGGLNPLLTVEEHEQLFVSVDPLEMAELVLRGLGRVHI
jgi:hypothetical protein